MTCERVRWLLSLDPLGRTLAHDPAALRHLDGCADCRAFARALTEVDEALAARPLAQPRPGFAAAVQAEAGRLSHGSPVERPFSRAFLAFAAALTMLALVSGALLLQQWPAAAATQPPADLAARLWVNPSWATDASAWLTLEADRAAQVALAFVAGLVITLAAATAGFKAHAHVAPRHTPPNGPRL